MSTPPFRPASSNTQHAVSNPVVTSDRSTTEHNINVARMVAIAMFHAQSQAAATGQAMTVTTNQALEAFMALSPTERSRVSATFVARQRIAARDASNRAAQSVGEATPAATTASLNNSAQRPALAPSITLAPSNDPPIAPYANSVSSQGAATNPTLSDGKLVSAPSQKTLVPISALEIPRPPAPVFTTRPPSNRPEQRQTLPIPGNNRANLVQKQATPERDEAAAIESKRRRDDGLRGQMRSEISRLMYATGDVADPEPDSVDFVEDLVVEFLTDLCRPIPPIRINNSSAYVPVPLTAETVRHRLSSHSYLQKYVDRWDEMTFMWAELQASKRVAAPSHADLIASVGKQFLGLDGDQDVGVGATGSKRRTATVGEDGPPRRGRPPKNPEDRKKPGPKKGWKRTVDGAGIPKRRPPTKPYKRKERPISSSAAPSPSVKVDF